jgi:hypothetical protein
MTGMDNSQKLPPERIDSLASQLKGSLRRRRPRTWLIVISAVVVILGSVSLLAWWYYDRPEPPRLEVVVFDAIAATDETPQVAAQLAFPEPGEFSTSLLAGRDMVFLDMRAAMMPGQQGHEVKTTSDAQGRAVVDWSRPALGKAETVIVRYVDVRKKHGSSDQAMLFGWDRGSKVLLVDVEETLYQKPGNPARPAKIAPPQAAATLREAERRGYHVAYLSVTASEPLEYRIARGWIGQHVAKDGVPLGPVLGRLTYLSPVDADQARRERVADMKQHLGGNITFVTRTAFAATAATANQVRAIVLEPGENLPGATRVRGWAEVVSLLGKD